MRIEFINTTATISDDREYPPQVLCNTTLKKCFLDAARILNAHQKVHTGKWHTNATTTGSAYLNVVAVLYCNHMFKEKTRITAKKLHEISRYLWSVAPDFYLAEINTVSDSLAGFALYIEDRFPWTYSTTGLQLLRTYSLLYYMNESQEVRWAGILHFCKQTGINLEQTDTVELKAKKVLSLGNVSLIIGESVTEDALDLTMELFKQLANYKELELASLKELKLQTVVRASRNGQACAIDSLDTAEFAAISTQLQSSPSLLKLLLRLGTADGRSIS